MLNSKKEVNIAPEEWSTPPTVSDLKEDLISSKSAHDTQVSKVNEWLDNLNITGSAKKKKVKGRSNVQPKLIRKQAEWRYAALSEPFLARPDLFQIDPVTYEDKPSAIQNEHLLNYQFNNKIDKTRFIDEYVRTAVDEGTAIVRVGWISEEEEVTRDETIYEFYPAQNHDEIRQLTAYAQAKQSNPAAYEAHTPHHIKQALQYTEEQGVPIVPKAVGQETITEVKLVKNHPTLEICEYQNVHIDPSCGGDLTKAEFVIYSFESNKSTLERQGIYQNLDQIVVQDNSSAPNDPEHTSYTEDSFNFKDEPRTKVVVYEYWGWKDVDGSGMTVPIVASWVGDVMIRLEENPYPFKNVPFVNVQYLPVRKSVYGEPDGELLKDNQDIVGAVTRGAIDLMGRSANSQQGIRKDALDAVNKRRYDNGLDYEFNPAVDPRQAIIQHQYPEIPNSVGLMLSLQNNEAESLTGVKAFTGGISGDALGDTATSVRGALDAASKRELGILRRLADGITTLGKYIIEMNKEFLSDEEIVRVTNEEFVAIRRDELQGNFDLKLKISTAEEDNQKASELSFMLQTIGNSMPREFSQLILADIAHLRKMPELAKKIETFQPQPDPIQQQIQMLELQKLQAEINVLQSKGMEHQGQAILDQAKAGTEYAKQGNLQSDTDKKNLDFLEQESGVQHARELQKHSEQARGNMALEILKSELGQS